MTTPSLETSQPASSQPPKGERFHFVDALRGIAALWVVIFHAYGGKHLELSVGRSPKWVSFFFESGHFGVPIFFVLSGFVIAYSVSRSRVDLSFVARFAARRSIRLDPPYWGSMVLAIGLGLVSKLANPAKPYEAPTLGQVTAHIFYAQQILGFPPFNAVYWTLTYEVQFYLVFCLLLWLVHATRRDEADKRSLFLVFGPSLILAAAWPLGLLSGEGWFGWFPPFWHAFLLGMLACWVMLGTVRPRWFLGYAAILLIGTLLNRNEFTLVCVFTSALLAIAASTGGLSRWLNWRWLQFLGLISYSLYLTHNPITGAFYNIGYRITGRSLASEVLLFAPMIAVNVAVAWLMWWLLERPSMALAHRIKIRRG